MITKFRVMLLIAALCGLVFAFTPSVSADVPPDDPNEPWIRPDPNNFVNDTTEDEDVDDIVADENGKKTGNESGTTENVKKPKIRRCGSFGVVEMTVFFIVVMSVYQLRRVSRDPDEEK